MKVAVVPDRGASPDPNWAQNAQSGQAFRLQRAVPAIGYDRLRAGGADEAEGRGNYTGGVRRSLSDYVELTRRVLLQSPGSGDALHVA